MGSFRDVGRPGSVLDHQGVPVPPAREHPGVDVPRATAAGERERFAQHAGRPLHATHRHCTLTPTVYEEIG